MPKNIPNHWHELERKALIKMGNKQHHCPVSWPACCRAHAAMHLHLLPRLAIWWPTSSLMPPPHQPWPLLHSTHNFDPNLSSGDSNLELRMR
jgi:hypothetical protein